MSKLFGYGESLEGKTEAILKDCEGIMDLAFKASGSSIMDVMSGLDTETGAILGGCVNLYKNTKDLAVMQAKAMDKMLSDFDELKEMNKDLREQNEKLQKMLQELSRKIEK